MPVTIRNSVGGTLTGSDGRVNDLSTSQSTKTSVHKLPGADKDLVQKLGMSNRRFTLKGFVTTLAGSGFIDSVNNNTGSISFSRNLGTLLSATTVLCYDLEWLDCAFSPLERRFSLSAVEFI